MTEEKRVRIYSISKRRILELLNIREEPPRLIELPYLNIPEGSKVESVNFCWETDSFRFLVSNPDFDPVPPCKAAPEHTETLICRYHIPVRELVLNAAPELGPAHDGRRKGYSS